MNKDKLKLEILTGPLDGSIIELDLETQWSCVGDGPLTFPWDEELGEPQAAFSLTQAGWCIEGIPSPHGTYLINRGERIEDKVVLEKDDIIKASHTWLLVK